jgi:hypothetical protein
LPVLHDVRVALRLHLLIGEPIRKLATRGFRYPRASHLNWRAKRLLTQTSDP